MAGPTTHHDVLPDPASGSGPGATRLDPDDSNTGAGDGSGTAERLRRPVRPPAMIPPMATLALLHTAASNVDVFESLIADVLPGMEHYHLLDESLLREAVAAGGAPPLTFERVAAYVSHAERRPAARPSTSRSTLPCTTPLPSAPPSCTCTRPTPWPSRVWTASTRQTCCRPSPPTSSCASARLFLLLEASGRQYHALVAGDVERVTPSSGGVPDGGATGVPRP